VLGAADDDIRLDTHSLKFFDACLCRFCLKLTGSLDIRDQCDMDQNRVFVSDLMLELADRL